MNLVVKEVGRVWGQLMEGKIWGQNRLYGKS